MDGSQFDRLAREMAAGRSRRSVMKGLGAAALGALGLAGAGHEAAAADACKGAGKACSKGSQCCSGLCAPPPAGHTSVAGSGSVCCAPEARATTCAGKCGMQTNNCGQSVDCGGCLPVGSACTTDAQCSSGICNAFYHVCLGCVPAGQGLCRRDADCCPGSTCDSTNHCQ